MKKQTKKLVLAKETLVKLETHDLELVAGGSDGTVGPNCSAGCYPKPTIIIVGTRF